MPPLACSPISLVLPFTAPLRPLLLVRLLHESIPHAPSGKKVKRRPSVKVFWKHATMYFLSGSDLQCNTNRRNSSPAAELHNVWWHLYQYQNQSAKNHFQDTPPEKKEKKKEKEQERRTEPTYKTNFMNNMKVITKIKKRDKIVRYKYIPKCF